MPAHGSDVHMISDTETLQVYKIDLNYHVHPAAATFTVL